MITTATIASIRLRRVLSIYIGASADFAWLLPSAGRRGSLASKPLDHHTCMHWRECATRPFARSSTRIRAHYRQRPWAGRPCTWLPEKRRRAYPLPSRRGHHAASGMVLACYLAADVIANRNPKRSHDGRWHPKAKALLSASPDLSRKQCVSINRLPTAQPTHDQCGKRSPQYCGWHDERKGKQHGTRCYEPHQMSYPELKHGTQTLVGGSA
jgi:hypothetical protein